MAAGGPQRIIAKLDSLGQSWRLNPFAFTGLTSGDFPLVWFLTMLVIAVIGGFGMGTSIDWYPEAQRIQSARTVRDASYSIWVGSALIVVRNSLWAVAILAFFTLYPHIQSGAQYEMAWYRLGFEFLPVGLVGFFFAAVVAIHLSTISTHLNLCASYATRDLYQHYFKPEASEKELVWGSCSLIFLTGKNIRIGRIDHVRHSAPSNYFNPFHWFNLFPLSPFFQEAVTLTG